MRGKPLIAGFLALVVVFTAALIWFQFFAYYERTQGSDAVSVNGAPVTLTNYDGIDATSSPLKRRACFTADPAAFAAATPATDAVPLTAPFWFRCFDAGALTADLAAGAATAYALQTDDPAGFDLIAALYPDGRGYLWRQLNARFSD